MAYDESLELRTGTAATPRRFNSTLAWVKADGPGTEGTFSLVELLAPAGWATPWHVHAHHEYFYVLEGRITAIVGEARVSLGAGEVAFGPRDVPHGFRVEGSTPARILMMTDDGDFAAFFREVSDPTDSDALPEPAEPDIPRIVVAAGRHGIEILGPMPE